MASHPKDAARIALEKLTPQRRKFVEAYCASFNATKAALKAGYSKKTARTQGSHLLTIVDIKSAIKEMLSTAGMDPEEIAARWDRIAKADLSDFYTKQQVEYTPRIAKPLAQVVEEFRRDVEFEQELAMRAEALISDKKKRENFRKKAQAAQVLREFDLLRLEMELERAPNAVRWVDGPKEWRYEMRLDLVKAEELGMLDLVKSITEGRNGTSFSLRDPDAALDNLAKWRGMLTTKVDITSGGEPVAAPPLLGVLSLEQKKELLEKRKQLRAQQEGAANE